MGVLVVSGSALCPRNVRQAVMDEPPNVVVDDAIEREPTLIPPRDQLQATKK